MLPKHRVYSYKGHTYVFPSRISSSLYHAEYWRGKVFVCESGMNESTLRMNKWVQLNTVATAAWLRNHSLPPKIRSAVPADTHGETVMEQFEDAVERGTSGIVINDADMRGTRPEKMGSLSDICKATAYHDNYSLGPTTIGETAGSWSPEATLAAAAVKSLRVLGDVLNTRDLTEEELTRLLLACREWRQAVMQTHS